MLQTERREGRGRTRRRRRRRRSRRRRRRKRRRTRRKKKEKESTDPDVCWFHSGFIWVPWSIVTFWGSLGAIRRASRASPRVVFFFPSLLSCVRCPYRKCGRTSTSFSQDVANIVVASTDNFSNRLVSWPVSWSVSWVGFTAAVSWRFHGMCQNPPRFHTHEKNHICIAFIYS